VKCHPDVSQASGRISRAGGEWNTACARNDP